MSAREAFENLGFNYVIEDKYGIEYLDSDVKYGREGVRSIYVDKEGNITATQGIYDGETYLELSKDMLVAVLIQLREFDIKL